MTAEYVPGMKVTDAMAEEGYQLCIQGAKGNTQIIQALELQRKGGPCPLCGVPFHRVMVRSEFGNFDYYEPACQCYRRCDGRVVIHNRKGQPLHAVAVFDGRVSCGRWLIAERFLDIHYCAACRQSFQADMKEQVIDLHPPRRRVAKSGKDAAAGVEREEE